MVKKKKGKVKEIEVVEETKESGVEDLPERNLSGNIVNLTDKHFLRLVADGVQFSWVGGGFISKDNNIILGPQVVERLCRLVDVYREQNGEVVDGEVDTILDEIDEEDSEDEDEDVENQEVVEEPIVEKKSVESVSELKVSLDEQIQILGENDEKLGGAVVKLGDDMQAVIGALNEMQKTLLSSKVEGKKGEEVKGGIKRLKF